MMTIYFENTKNTLAKNKLEKFEEIVVGTLIQFIFVSIEK